jgi:hypothetical protein
LALQILFLFQSLPEEFQILLAEHNSLVEQDFDQLAHSMREQGKAIMAKRGAELASKFFELSKRLNEVADHGLADQGKDFDEDRDDNANAVISPPDLGAPFAESQDKGSSPQPGAVHGSSSAAEAPADSSRGNSSFFPFVSPI